MTRGPQVLDVSGLPAIAFMSRSPIFWAAIGITMIEGTMFLLLVATYFYARLGVDVWPPPGTQFPVVWVPTVEVLVLLASVPPAYWASQASKNNDLPRLRKNLLANGLLAVAALVLRVAAWSTFNFTWKTDIHGSVVWMMLVLHTFEIVSAIVMTFWLFVLALTPRFSDPHRLAVDFDSITWYFLVAIWLPLYGTIYLAPWLVQAS